MAWPRKEITQATKIRNVYGPRSDRLVLLYACCETSGAALANVGLIDTYNSRFAGYDIGDGTIQGTPVFHNSGGDEEPNIELGDAAATAAYVDLVLADGADLEIPRGTLLLRFKGLTSVDAVRSVWHTGNTPTNVGVFLVSRGKSSGDEDLTVFLRFAAGDEGKIILLFDGTLIDWNVPHTVVVTWGERGLSAWLDTIDNVQADLSQPAGWKISNGKTLRLARDASDIMDVQVMIAGMWDVQLEANEIAELLDDPYLPARPAPDSSLDLSTQAGPAIGRTTKISAVLNFVTGTGPTLNSDQVAVRVVYGTDRTNLDNTSAAIKTPSDGHIHWPLEVPLTFAEGAAEGTRYYFRAEWTNDGSTWQPLPCGTGEFITQRDPENAQDFDALILADCHTSGTIKGEPDPLGEGFGIEQFNAGNVKHFAAWRAMQDACTKLSPDVIIHVGDHAMVDGKSAAGTADEDPQKFARYLKWRNFWARLLKRATLYVCIGNHEAECGYQQSADQGTLSAQQKQATIARKRYVPNPTAATYRWGGESEGAVSDNPSWVPSLDAIFDAAYRQTYCEHSENGSPLENYFAWDWGNVLFVVCDVFRYTEPGDPSMPIGTGGEHARGGPTWTLGALQEQWLANVLRQSAAVHKIVLMHHSPGGAQVHAFGGSPNWYGRGSRITFSTAEEERLHALFKETDVRGSIIGHDHKFCHVVNDQVNYITAPTVSAPSLCRDVEKSGWHGPTLADQYGTAESQGADLYHGGPGSGTAAGIRKMLNVLGYMYLRFSGSRCTLKLRRTETCRGDSPPSEVLTHNERFIGDVGDQIDNFTVSVNERPRDVGHVALQSLLVGPWWASVLPDLKGTPVGDYSQDEDFGDSQVTVEDTGGQPVAMGVTPAELYTAELAASAGGIGTQPQVVGIAVSSLWQAISSSPLIVDATIVVPPANGADVEVRWDGGDAEIMPPGSRLPIGGVDLARLEFKGTVGDRVLVVGNTRE
ncbi:MAG: metallophosphoesterase [bacterium]|nr:metallophosphoesterase [bacterium]